MKFRKNKIWNMLLWILFYGYIVCLGYFLFFSERYGRGILGDELRYNLELFKEISRFIRYRDIIGYESFVVNILGNIFAFAPFGFFLPLLNDRYRKFFLVTLLSMIFSLAIETIQMYSRVGIFDVDDIIMNTLGGMLGYLAFAILNRWVRKYKKK